MILSEFNDGYRCYTDSLILYTDDDNNSKMESVIQIQKKQKEIIQLYLESKLSLSYIIFGHEPLVSFKCKKVKNKEELMKDLLKEKPNIPRDEIIKMADTLYTEIYNGEDCKGGSKLKMVLLNLSKDYYSTDVSTYIIDNDSILEHIFSSMIDNQEVYYICADDHLMSHCTITSGTKKIYQIVMGTGGTKLDTCDDRMCRGTYDIQSSNLNCRLEYNNAMEKSYGYGIIKYVNGKVISLQFNQFNDFNDSNEESHHSITIPNVENKYLKYKNKYLSLKKKLII